MQYTAATNVDKAVKIKLSLFHGLGIVVIVLNPKLSERVEL
jgi:hypothetical protein